MVSAIFSLYRNLNLRIDAYTDGNQVIIVFVASAISLVTFVTSMIIEVLTGIDGVFLFLGLLLAPVMGNLILKSMKN